MYKLYLRLNSDGDFGYNSKFISNDRNDMMFISDDRNKLINVLINFYEDINFITNDEYEYIINVIFDFKEYLLELCKRVKTFRIIFNLGNYDFEIELYKYTIDNVCINDNFFVKKYNEEKVYYELYFTENFKKEIDIKNLKDLDIKYPILSKDKEDISSFNNWLKCNDDVEDFENIL